MYLSKGYHLSQNNLPSGPPDSYPPYMQSTFTLSLSPPASKYHRVRLRSLLLSVPEAAGRTCSGMFGGECRTLHRFQESPASEPPSAPVQSRATTRPTATTSKHSRPSLQIPRKSVRRNPRGWREAKTETCDLNKMENLASSSGCLSHWFVIIYLKQSEKCTRLHFVKQSETVSADFLFPVVETSCPEMELRSGFHCKSGIWTQTEQNQQNKAKQNHL